MAKDFGNRARSRFLTGLDFEQPPAGYPPVTSDPPISATQTPDGIHLCFDQARKFYAQITGRSSSAYAWQEMYESGPGTFTVVTGGLTGSTSMNPAYDLNGSTTVGNGTIIELIAGPLVDPAQGQVYLFAVSTAAAGTSFYQTVSVNGTIMPQEPRLDVLYVDNTGSAPNATPLSGTDSAGSATHVNLYNSSGSNAGVVRLGTQSLGTGLKTVDSLALAQSTGATVSGDPVLAYLVDAVTSGVAVSYDDYNLTYDL